MVEFAVTDLMEVSHAGRSFFLISFRPLKQLKVISPEFTASRVLEVRSSPQTKRAGEALFFRVFQASKCNHE